MSHKQQIKFIATDMDGTLLDENGNLDPQFFSLYEQLESENILFAPASGRQYCSLKETFAPISDRMLFITDNGALVMHKGEELYSRTIEPAALKEMIKAARKIEGTHLTLCGKDSAFIETRDPAALAEIKKYNPNPIEVDDLLTVEDEIIKIAICHLGGTQEHVYPQLSELFGESHSVVVSGKLWLDIMEANVTKGAAIRYLREKFGFTFEQTMSFGDYLNDLEMLNESYHSYAMENAHPEVKKIARFSAPSNTDSGVYRVLQKYLDSLS